MTTTSIGAGVYPNPDAVSQRELQETAKVAGYAVDQGVQGLAKATLVGFAAYIASVAMEVAFAALQGVASTYGAAQASACFGNLAGCAAWANSIFSVFSLPLYGLALMAAMYKGFHINK